MRIDRKVLQEKYGVVRVSGRRLLWNNSRVFDQLYTRTNYHPLLERVADNIRLEHLLHRMKVIHGARRPKTVAAMERRFRENYNTPVEPWPTCG